ncbi:hypothetical protein G8767_03680 [Rhodococcus sp. IC4_135]|nr:hypothetical protein [Rhodococcus sp. IC4_135]
MNDPQGNHVVVDGYTDDRGGTGSAVGVLGLIEGTRKFAINIFGRRSRRW